MQLYSISWSKRSCFFAKLDTLLWKSNFGSGIKSEIIASIFLIKILFKIMIIQLTFLIPVTYFSFCGKSIGNIVVVHRLSYIFSIIINHSYVIGITNRICNLFSNHSFSSGNLSANGFCCNLELMWILARLCMKISAWILEVVLITSTLASLSSTAKSTHWRLLHCLQPRSSRAVLHWSKIWYNTTNFLINLFY